jgi:hypothetical protein
MKKRRHDTQHNNTQHNITQQNVTQHNNIQHNNKKATLNIMTFIITAERCYAECLLS